MSILHDKNLYEHILPRNLGYDPFEEALKQNPIKEYNLDNQS